jgi:hypothetical protein
MTNEDMFVQVGLFAQMDLVPSSPLYVVCENFCSFFECLWENLLSRRPPPKTNLSPLFRRFPFFAPEEWRSDDITDFQRQWWRCSNLRCLHE